MRSTHGAEFPFPFSFWALSANLGLPLQLAGLAEFLDFMAAIRLPGQYQGYSVSTKLSVVLGLCSHHLWTQDRALSCTAARPGMETQDVLPLPLDSARLLSTVPNYGGKCIFCKFNFGRI